MPNSPSAKKSLRQNKKHNALNKTRKSLMRTAVKKAVAAIGAGDVEKAVPQVQAAEARLDKNVRKGVLHRNAASRFKSRIAKKLNALASKEK